MFVCSQSRIREHCIVNIDKRSSIRIHVLTRIAKYLKDNKLNGLYFAIYFYYSNSLVV